ncbi:hypothetical protein SAMN07250955_11952 [Arboricoccus pini]|uniref:Uncharacterized protein n=1 Tax=Arboricoccus pini TaxID=1963835 RepID=A0A212S165_9PROT|nr:hypothetical protein SAMN07250955_11952 [Arboricoccus pini]
MFQLISAMFARLFASIDDEDQRLMDALGAKVQVVFLD